MSKENFFEKPTDINFLDKFNFIYRSFSLSYKKDHTGNYIKKAKLELAWQKETESKYDSELNGVYIITGLISNLFVIDIDDVDKCSKLKNILDDDCNLVAKTKKGFHYYYQYDSELCKSNQYGDIGFDIRADGGMIYAPPTYYYDQYKQKIVYEYIKKPLNNELNKINNDIKKYLFELINNRKPKVKKNKEKKIKKKTIKEDKEINDFDTEYIKLLLKDKIEYKDQLKNSLNDIIINMNYENHDLYIDWIKVGMGLKNFGNYGLSLWHKISSQSPKYNYQELEKQFNGFNNINDIGYGSLLYWLKEDNPEYYNRFYEKNKEMINYILKSEEEIEIEFLDKLYEDKDIGFVKIYWKYFNDVLVCISQERQMFYLYNDNNGLWEQKTGKDIQYHFMDNMAIIINKLADYYKKIMNEFQLSNEEKFKFYKKKYENIINTPEFHKASKSKPLLNLIESKFFNNDFIIKLNNNPILLPVKNGIIDLQTGLFRKRTKTDYCSFELDVEWKGLNYNTDFINSFFDDIMLNDKNMINYLQKIFGYSITGFTNEHLIVIMHGCGGNGKTVLQNALKNLLGSYYGQLSTEVIIETKKNNAGAPSPHMMSLLGIRLGFVDESEENAKLNEATVKSITGGGSITARPLYGNIIKFEPTHQLFLLTNYKPEIKVNKALRRRIILIPFDAEFVSESKFDKNNNKHRIGNKDIEKLVSKKLDELLVWLVNGSVRYFKEGLENQPEKIITATNEYMNENDDISNFLNEYCEKDSDNFISNIELYNLFKYEYKSTITLKSFIECMKVQGYILIRRNSGRGYTGLKIKNREITSD